MLLGASYSMFKSGAFDIDMLPLFGMALTPGSEDGLRKQENGGMDRPADRDATACSEEEDVEADGCNNTLQYVSLLLADSHRHRMTQLVVQGSFEVFLAYKVYKHVRSEKYIFLLNQGMPIGNCKVSLRKTVATLTKIESLQKMRFRYDFDLSELQVFSAVSSSSHAAPSSLAPGTTPSVWSMFCVGSSVSACFGLAMRRTTCRLADLGRGVGPEGRVEQCGGRGGREALA